MKASGNLGLSAPSAFGLPHWRARCPRPLRPALLRWRHVRPAMMRDLMARRDNGFTGSRMALNCESGMNQVDGGPVHSKYQFGPTPSHQIRRERGVESSNHGQ